MSEKKSFGSGLLCGLFLAVFLLGSAYLCTQLYRQSAYRSASADAGEKDTVVNAATENKMRVIKDTVEKYYLEDVDEADMEEGVYAGMIASLGDPYAAYYSQEDLKALREDTQGIYYGIGAYMRADADTGLPMITGTIEGSPAEESGLRYGDLICEVGEESVEGMSTSEVITLIHGEEHTKVRLRVYREGEPDFLEFEIERKKIESPSVAQKMLDDRMAYIQITEFSDVTPDQFTEALAVCKESGMEGLILDLRGNPGGNVTAVTQIAREILPAGLIVYTEDKNGKRTEYTCDGERELNVPLVVLVDEGSASASEILAGAIRDYGKGTLLGTTTYGKGIVQRVVPLTDGSALKLTVSRYYTPKGQNIHGVGIVPDVEVAFDADAYLEDGTDNQLERAEALLREQLSETAARGNGRDDR